jgi:hypothetical protein
MKTNSTTKVTRAALIRAFSSPARSRTEVGEIVARYMGDSPVPPSWSIASVRGVFGRRIAREWARHIRHLQAASHRGENGRWLHPLVQTAYDFGRTPEALRVGLAVPADAADGAGQRSSFMIDEAHLLFGQQRAA